MFPAVAILLFAAAFAATSADEQPKQIYKMCVPQKYYQDCLELLKDPSEAGILMECVSGRDRIDCLDLINQRKADVLAADPEDMYVAYHTKNSDYRVISEFRTAVEKDAEFRYEGVILVKKNSNIKGLKDLKGAKSCHTGFGRNVGYRIPITKLKNSNVLKVSMDPLISSTERELKALSEFFSKSCLVGKYSPHPEIDAALKKKYSNLCAICEKPEQCDYPDKYSHYDGAIRCLDKGSGDVAFTKTSFIKKYFGLLPGITAEGNPDDFEYLCEDGKRLPITGPACSWAQRPWKGYISNTDAAQGENSLKKLQTRLQKFFDNGLHAQNKIAAKHLLIDPDLVYHSKPTAVEPKEYLERAGYKDVIERDGSAIRKLKLCVSKPIEMEKCNAMRRAAYSRDVRPEIECIQDTDCIGAVQKNQADMLALRGNEYKLGREATLHPLVYESYGDDDYYVAIVDPKLPKDAIMKTPASFNANSERARLAARLLNKRRGINSCNLNPSDDGKLKIVRSIELEKYKNYQLLCGNLEKKPVTEMRTCNIEAMLPGAIFVRDGLSNIEQDTIKHLFTSLSAKFGSANSNDIFSLFGEFKKGSPSVLFDDDAKEFVTELKNINTDENIYNQLSCDEQ